MVISWWVLNPKAIADRSKDFFTVTIKLLNVAKTAAGTGGDHPRSSVDARLEQGFLWLQTEGLGY